MSIYDEVNELLEPIDLTLDMMKKFIQPTIFSGLKSNIESIKHTTKSHEERAKKEHELVGLYRHLYFHDKMMSEDEFYQTLYKIKALEEELK